jgi:CDP-glycerol glycerophosphotransferase (TagB/SpsB family)
VLKSTKNVWIDKSWQANESKGQINITRADIEHLCSTLKHCVVHINASSTLTVDGAVFDRPQIGPAYDPGISRKYDRVLKELYVREHYQPITNSGGLDVVRSREELIHAVNEAFDHPEAKTAGRKKIVTEICTYADGGSTHRVVSKMKELVG